MCIHGEGYLLADAAQLQEEIESLKSENLILRAKVEWLQKRVFGGRKSEKLEVPLALVLKLGQMEKTAARLPRTVTSHERRAPKERPMPAEVFAHLPVIEVIEIIPEEVKANPEAYERIGEAHL